MPTPNAPPEPAVTRFRRDLEALTGGEGRVLLAVSGGADSLAMLLLARQAAPDRIVAVTVDHGLRSESPSEAAHVRAICDDLGVAHWTAKVTVRSVGNVSDRARVARYGGLRAVAEQQGLAWIATAHHADDQLETMLMRLNRGAGLGGLAGIRRRNGNVIRPLLDWTHRELAGLVADAGLVPVDDPSNRDNRYDRARLRSALAGADWLDAQAAARSAAWLEEAGAALDWAAARIVPDAATMADLPDELARRVVLNALMTVNPDAGPNPGQLARAVATLRSGRRTTLAGVVCTPGPRWRFALAPPRRPIRPVLAD